MRNKKLLLFSIFLGLCAYYHQSFNNPSRSSSFPYISGDTFRDNANFIIDETNGTIDPTQVKDGNIIFLKTDFLEQFLLNIHPQITAPYILITHNSDYPAPAKYDYMLDDPKLIIWFAQNADIASHPKLIPIPIGVANSYWPHGNMDILNQVVPMAGAIERNKLLYLNISVETNASVRDEVMQLFSTQSFCYTSSSKPWSEYLKDMASSKFILSPRGNGEDCHRTWEALLMGCIPIVKSSSIDPLFQDLPVVIINDWNQVTEEFLIQKHIQMSCKNYNMDKMYAAWWIDKIKNHANS